MDSILSPILGRLLRKYFNNPPDVKFSLSGSFHFGNLEFNCKTLNSQLTSLPFTYQNGIAGSTRLDIPWASLSTDPIVGLRSN